MQKAAERESTTPKVGTTAAVTGGSLSRMTVDIDQGTRDELAHWALEANLKHRTRVVSVAPAVRVLLAMMLDDDKLSAQVIERLKAGEGKR